MGPRLEMRVLLNLPQKLVVKQVQRTVLSPIWSNPCVFEVQRTVPFPILLPKERGRYAVAQRFSPLTG